MMRSDFMATGKVLALLLFLILLQLCVVSAAYSLEVPALQGRVNDYGAMLSAATESQLDKVLAQLEQTDSTQIAVLTIPSLEGEDLEQFSLKVVETWKLGQKEYDNGAMLLIAVRDRKVRIEVGYGLEGTLTDLKSGRIIRNVILPKFKQGNFNQGAIDGVNAMIGTVQGNYSPPQRASRSEQQDPFGMIALLIFFSFFVGNIFRKNKFASAAVSAIGAPLIGTFLFGFSLPLFIALIFVGIVFGLIAAKLHIRAGRSGISGRSGYYGSGGFGSSSGGFGGFSGGGGGFGGGGASGGW